ncbi:MAG: DUF885 domain-containing protein [Hyphomonas sp.]
MTIIRSAFALTLLATTAACGTPSISEPAAPATLAETATVQTESVRLNAWFEQKFDESVARDPMRQTFLGIKDNYGEWSDASDGFEIAELEIQRANVAEMKASFDFDKLDDQTKLSWRLAEYQLERAEAGFPYRHYNYTFNQMHGVQSGIPAFLINQHKITSKSDAEAYISRLNGIDTYLGQHLANAKASAAMGIMPPAFVYDYVLADAKGLITGYPFTPAGEGVADSPLMEDFRGKVTALVANSTVTEEEAADLNARAAEALISSVGPAYEATIEELTAQQAVATTDDGAWKLPNGGDYYNQRLAQMTTTDMTAAEIHQLGLDEVARIHGEMEAIMKQVGFEGDLQAFFAFMRTDPQFYKPNTPEGKAEYLAEAEAAIEEMKGDLPKLFNTFPKADMEVKAVEPFREKSAGKAFYSRPAPDGSRPGIYYANLYDMADMPTYQLEALAYHEGIPGHHMQIAIAQELEGIPSFRKFGGYTAYSEGWGLYTELVPKELGYYKDPYSDFGRLAMEIWRAARLVVDTGIHDKKWTREEAIQYLMDNTPNPQGDCEKAIERYIVMPGQATAYKIGMLKIVELRERARDQLGDGFDIREFHDVVLKDGAVPLAVLEETVDAWIAEKKA